jgi:hypothetical protein
MNQLDTLVHEGKSREAAREYRDRFGVSWDRAHNAVRNWDKDECERKLRVILEYMQDFKATPVPAIGQ